MFVPLKAHEEAGEKSPTQRAQFLSVSASAFVFWYDIEATGLALRKDCEPPPLQHSKCIRSQRQKRHLYPQRDASKESYSHRLCLTFGPNFLGALMAKGIV